MKKEKVLSISISIIYTLSLVLFAISFSIALPIYFRPFYYALVKPLKIVESVNSYTGLSLTQKEIIQAYDEVLNFCCFYTKFGAGKLKWSQEGMSHFADCRVLFTLDSIVMLITFFIIVGVHVIKRKFQNIKLVPFVHLIAGISSILIPIVIGILASINFDKAFEIFHKIFFPGKENWLFDASQDQIILAMPEEFFISCAILIGVSLLSISIYYLIRGIISIKKIKEEVV